MPAYREAVALAPGLPTRLQVSGSIRPYIMEQTKPKVQLSLTVQRLSLPQAPQAMDLRQPEGPQKTLTLRQFPDAETLTVRHEETVA